MKGKSDKDWLAVELSERVHLLTTYSTQYHSKSAAFFVGGFFCYRQ